MSYAFLTHILGYYICVYVRLFFFTKSQCFFYKKQDKKKLFTYRKILYIINFTSIKNNAEFKMVILNLKCLLLFNFSLLK